MLDIQGRKYAAVTVCDVTLYDLMTKYPVMYFDTLQITSIDSSVETTEINGGKGNSILASISHTKNVDVQFDDALMTMSSLALLTGGELTIGGQNEKKITMTQTEISSIEVEGSKNVVKLTETVKPNSYVYIGEIINGVVSTVTRSEEKLEGGSNSIEITDELFHNLDINVGADYRVFYEYELGFAQEENGRDIKELKVLADKFAGTYRFVGDTLLFNQFTGSNDVFQIEIPKLKLDSSFSFSFNAATEAVVFSFKGKALRDDFGNMIIFRNINSDATGDTASGASQLDGSYNTIPAKGVDVDSITGALTDNGKDYPVPGHYSF